MGQGAAERVKAFAAQAQRAEFDSQESRKGRRGEPAPQSLRCCPYKCHDMFLWPPQSQKRNSHNSLTRCKKF